MLIWSVEGRGTDSRKSESRVDGTWWWICMWQTNEKDPKMEAVAFYSLSVSNDAPSFCHLVHRRTLVQLGRGLHRDVNTRRWE